MDPVSALGIAAAVVQFADFGSRFIKSAHELYKSPTGQAPEYINLSNVSKNLLHLADTVKAKLDKYEGPTVASFDYVYRECKSTNDELQRILNELKVRGSTTIEVAADALRVAFQQVIRAGDIEGLENRLDNIRQEVNVAMLYMLLLVIPHPSPTSDMWGAKN